MRQIKFRGKSKDANEWVFGDFFDTRHSAFCNYMPTIIENGGITPIDFYLVIPETVGQFTGLTDKNGKEIYEGDIIKFQKYSNYDDEHSNLKRHIAKVIFKEGCFCWDILKEGSQSDFHYSYKTEPLKNTCTTWGLEIIGNIHDNPELLTK